LEFCCNTLTGHRNPLQQMYLVKT